MKQCKSRCAGGNALKLLLLCRLGQNSIMEVRENTPREREVCPISLLLTGMLLGEQND